MFSTRQSLTDAIRAVLLEHGVRNARVTVELLSESELTKNGISPTRSSALGDGGDGLSMQLNRVSIFISGPNGGTLLSESENVEQLLPPPRSRSLLQNSQQAALSPVCSSAQRAQRQGAGENDRADGVAGGAGGTQSQPPTAAASCTLPRCVPPDVLAGRSNSAVGGGGEALPQPQQPAGTPPSSRAPQRGIYVEAEPQGGTPVDPGRVFPRVEEKKSAGVGSKQRLQDLLHEQEVMEQESLASRAHHEEALKKAEEYLQEVHRAKCVAAGMGDQLTLPQIGFRSGPASHRPSQTQAHSMSSLQHGNNNSSGIKVVNFTMPAGEKARDEVMLQLRTSQGGTQHVSNKDKFSMLFKEQEVLMKQQQSGDAEYQKLLKQAIAFHEQQGELRAARQREIEEQQLSQEEVDKNDLN